MEASFDSFIVQQSPKNLKYGLLSITPESRYSSLMPWHFKQVYDIVWNETKGIKINTVVDANAHIGVDSILFRLLFPTAEITSIEMDKNTFGQLQKNVNKLAMITNIKNVKSVNTLNMDCLDYVYDAQYEFVYFDPPWNDLDYKSKTITDLYLSGVALSEIVNKVLEQQKGLVCIKLPYNVDLNQYKEKINCKYFKSYNIYTSPKKVKISYVLVFIK